MEYIIDIGHNSPPKDLGAGSRVNDKQNTEDYYAKLIGEHLNKLLIENGHSTTLVCPGYASSVPQSLKARVRKANQQIDNSLFISIHLNDADPTGHGSEVFVFSKGSRAYEPAKKVLANIHSLGYRNRGVKTAKFYVLRYTKMPAMLVECCFVDSLEDRAILTQPDGTKDLAIAIYEGVTGDKYQPIDDDSEINEPAFLKVVDPTPLKLDTADTSTYTLEEKEELVWLQKGHYDVMKIGSEEGHYYLEFLPDKSHPSIVGEYFVYSGHCELISKNQ